MQNLGVELAGGAHGDSQSVVARPFESAFDFGKRLREVRGDRNQRFLSRRLQGGEGKQQPDSRAPQMRAVAPTYRYLSSSGATRLNIHTQNAVAMAAPAI